MLNIIIVLMTSSLHTLHPVENLMFLVMVAFGFTFCILFFPLTAPGWHECGWEVHHCPDWCYNQLQRHHWHHGIWWVASSLWCVRNHKRQQVGCGDHLSYFSWGKLCRRYHQQQGLLAGEGEQTETPRFSQLFVCGGRLAKKRQCNNRPWIFRLHPIGGWWIGYQKCFDRSVDQEKWGVQGWSSYLALFQIFHNILLPNKKQIVQTNWKHDSSVGFHHDSCRSFHPVYHCFFRL